MSNTIHSYRNFSNTIKSFLKTSANGSTINFNTPGSERPIRSFQKTGRNKFREIHQKITASDRTITASAVIPLRSIHKFEEKTGAERHFISKYSPKFNLPEGSPDKKAYNEKRKILGKCLLDIFRKKNSNKDAIGEFIFNTFNTTWKTFTCDNVQNEFKTQQGGKRRSTRKMKRRH